MTEAGFAAPLAMADWLKGRGETAAAGMICYLVGELRKAADDRDKTTELILAAERVVRKYGITPDGEPSDWTEWQNLRAALADLAMAARSDETPAAAQPEGQQPGDAQRQAPSLSPQDPTLSETSPGGGVEG